MQINAHRCVCLGIFMRVMTDEAAISNLAASASQGNKPQLLGNLKRPDGEKA